MNINKCLSSVHVPWGISVSKLDAIASHLFLWISKHERVGICHSGTHSDVPAAVTSPLLLVLFLAEARTTSDDQVLARLHSIVIL